MENTNEETRPYDAHAVALGSNLAIGDTIERGAWIKSAQSFRVDVLATLQSRSLYLDLNETSDDARVVALGEN